MILRNRAWQIAFASLVFFVLCQIANTLLGEPAVCNTGIGLGVNIPALLLLFLATGSLLFAGALVRSMLQEPCLVSCQAILGGSFLFGGAFSNITDRMLRGCVPDFFHISFFPAFNLADIGISLGAFILMISILKRVKTETTITRKTIPNSKL